MKIPPTLRDWKQANQESCDLLNPLMGLGLRQAQLPYVQQNSQLSSTVTNTESHFDDDDIIVINFVTAQEPDDDVAVMIHDTLSKESTIGKVVEDGDVSDELGIKIASDDRRKVIIKRKNCIDFSIRYNKL